MCIRDRKRGNKVSAYAKVRIMMGREGVFYGLVAMEIIKFSPAGGGQGGGKIYFAAGTLQLRRKPNQNQLHFTKKTSPKF